MILVVGARGVLGRVVVERLVAAGREVMAAGRDPARLGASSGVRTVRLDVRDTTSIRDALDGVDTVVSAIHGLAPPTRDNHPGIVDGAGVRALVDESAAAGVGRFVFLSAKGAAPDAPSRFFRLKHEAEQHLRASTLDWTIVRPAAFIEVHGLQLMGEPLRAGKAVRLVGPAGTPIDWVSVEDVADVIVSSLDGPSRRGAVVEVVGPRKASRLEVIDVLERAAGMTARRSHLPRPVAAFVQRVGALVNPGVGYLLEAALGEDAAPGHSTPADVAVTGTRTLEDVAARWAVD